MTDVARTITLDDVTAMLLDLLRDEIDSEPPRPDPDTLVHLMSEQARTHEQWAARVDATRLMLGWRLVSLVLDQTRGRA